MNKKFLEILLFSAAIFGFPGLVKAEIRINEVAWMGTVESQYEEWIELYNDGTETSLEGWKIYKAGGSTLLINLSGNISAGEYLLVCRTTPSVSNPLSGTCDINGSFGGSGLNNSSEHIVLKNNSGSTVDSINATSGWPAGDSTSKATMQWSGSSWITATGTPGVANATSGNGDTNNEENEEENTDEEEESEEINVEDAELITPKIYSTRVLKVEYPKIAIIKSPTHFRAQALDYDRSDLFKGHYVWNMGDGTIREFALGFRETNNGFDHVYEYPGTYTVNVKYFTGFLKDVPAELEETFIVDVGTATVSISKIYPDGAIEIKNTSGNILDLTDWQLRDASGQNFTFPEGTKIAANKTVVFTKKVTKLNTSLGVNIFTPTNSFVETNFVNKNRSTNSKQTSVEKTEEKIQDGEVLGVAKVENLEEKSKNKEKGNGIIWFLIFVILILIAIIAVIFLKKEEISNEEYELIDE